MKLSARRPSRRGPALVLLALSATLFAQAPDPLVVVGIELSPSSESLPTQDASFVLEFSRAPPVGEPMTAGEFTLELLPQAPQLELPQSLDIFRHGFESDPGATP